MVSLDRWCRLVPRPRLAGHRRRTDVVYLVSDHPALEVGNQPQRHPSNTSTMVPSRTGSVKRQGTPSDQHVCA